MPGFTRKLIIMTAGISLCAVPIGAIAAAPAPAIQPAAAAQTVNPWLALSAMTTNSSTASAAASAAAQEEGGGIPSAWPAWVVIGLTVAFAVYLGVKGDSNNNLHIPTGPIPISPA